MTLKRIKYTLSAIAILVIAYNSLYFKSLSEVRNSVADKFDAEAYAHEFWITNLIPRLEQAVTLNELILLLQTEKETAFRKYSNALGIGNIRYFLVKGAGKITAVNENDMVVSIKTGTSTIKIALATEFVYGNTIRDAVGGIKLNDFSNTMDLNKVSEQLNKKIRTEILPPFKAQAEKGDTIQFTGAIELNKKYMDLESIEVIPIDLNFIKNL